MPITNNIILIDGEALRPAPQFTLSNEKFTSGDYIIGGFIKVQLAGQLIGTSSNDLNSKISTLSSYHANCLPILISCGEKEVINGSGFFRTVNISPSDQPYMVTYTIDIEVTRNFSNKAILPDEEFLTLYDITLPDNIHLSSYEESLAIATTDDIVKIGVFGSNTFSKPSIKLTGSITIQAHNSMCSDISPSDMLDGISSIINNRGIKILNLNSELSSAYPMLTSYFDGSWTAVHDTRSLTINKLDNKIEWRFDMFIYKGSCNPKAIVSLDVDESTDQTNGMSTFTLKGNIKGLSDQSTGIIDNAVTSNTRITNARDVYANISGPNIDGFYGLTLLGCKTAASLPSASCYQRMSSQVTQNFNNGEINFIAVYGDAESCQLGGTSIDVSITENRPVRNQVTFIVPGGTPSYIVQISDTYTPLRVEVTVAGKLNSCNTDLITNLQTCVNNTLNNIISSYAGYLLEEESTTTGKYSYSITQKYIDCGS